MHPVPAALAALHDRWSTAPELEGVLVFPGPAPDAGSDAPDVLAIGDAVSDIAAVDSTPVFGLASTAEPFEVQCAIQSWSGDVAQQAMCERAFEWLDAVAAVIEQDSHLGIPEMVWDCRISRWRYRAIQDGGAIARIEFAVLVEARR